MHTLLKTKIGPFLVISSVLAAWTLLAAQPVQAHSNTEALPAPSCSGLPTADDFFGADEAGGTAALASDNADDAPTAQPGTGSPRGNTNFHYAKITVPALTAGNLVVASTTTPADAILCGRQEGNVTARTTYAAHNSAEIAQTAATNAQTAATNAQTTAGNNDTAGGESTARGALRNAATALRTVATALRTVATALRNAGNESAATTAESAADAADDPDSDNDARDNALVAAGTTVGARTGVGTDSSTSDEVSALSAAAGALGTAAGALGAAADTFHIGFTIDTVISSGDEEYVVVVSSGATVPTLNVTFQGVISTVLNAADEDEFTLDNQLITRTLATTATAPGLLTVRTTGSAVDTKGTLDDDTTNPLPGDAGDLATDAGSGGNFEIVSPVAGGTTYRIHVEGQTPGERGEFGLEVEFGVASTTLTLGTTPADTALKPGRSDYFFFTVAAGAHSFLTVGTETPTSATTETDTTGAFFSRQGLVATDTNSGPGNNFLLRVPISPGDYIVEVKGASPSTEGAYNLVTNNQAVDTTRQHGSAPDSITGSATGTIAARMVVPHSITVATPGTLQVKTTGSIDTVGVLYGPDGQQIATDDNSGTGTNFLITQYVGAGQYIVTVGGRTAGDTGGYTLVVNFVQGATVDGPTTPGTGTGAEAELRNRIAELERDLAICEEPIVTDATGNLGNPSGARSGIGLISGWVCEADEVTVQIFHATQGRVRTLNVAYGTSRPDTVGQCRHNSPNTGFGMTFNFNQLPEGNYTIQAFADEDEIGEEKAFSVNHLMDFATADLAPFDTDNEDRFLRGLPGGTCSVENFPTRGDTTRLEWEQSLQNFTIINVQ